MDLPTTSCNKLLTVTVSAFFKPERKFFVLIRVKGRSIPCAIVPLDDRLHKPFARRKFTNISSRVALCIIPTLDSIFAEVH
jgi:hypothetical protein